MTHEFSVKLELIERAVEVVNKFKSEQVQLRVLDALIEALPGPERFDEGEDER